MAEIPTPVRGAFSDKVASWDVVLTDAEVAMAARDIHILVRGAIVSLQGVGAEAAYLESIDRAIVACGGE